MSSKKYKIIHLTTVHQPYDIRILRRECVSLAAEPEYSVSLFNSHGEDGWFDSVRLASFDRKKRGRIGRLFISGWRAYRAVKHAAPDLCHIHDPEIIWIGFLLKMNGTRVVYDVHEDYESNILGKQWLPKWARWPVSKGYRMTASILVRWFDATISATERIASKQNARRNYTIHNYPRVQEIADERNGFVVKQNQILYTGGLTPNRGIEQVLKALCEHGPQDWRLIIVGGAEPHTERRLRGYLEDGRVEYKGMVPFEEVKGLLKESRIGVVCNQRGFDYENALPNKIFEYMAAGLIVVCSDFEAWKTIIDDGNAGFACDTSDPKVLGKTLRYVLENSESLEDRVYNGRKRVQECYSWERESKILLDAYRGVLHGH